MWVIDEQRLLYLDKKQIFESTTGKDNEINRQMYIHVYNQGYQRPPNENKFRLNAKTTTMVKIEMIN